MTDADQLKVKNNRRNTLPAKIWRKMCNFRFIDKKISTKNLERLCRETATDKMTLVIHSEDVDYRPHFPNAYAVTKRQDIPADMHVDLYYRDLSKIESESYEMVFCTGLLEHLPDPQRLVDEIHRILKPGGKMVLSASAVFSFHECPNDFFHFTPYSFKMMFEKWSEVEMLRGASQPFETIAILMQRILLQCETFPLIRPFIELLCVILPLFDKLIYKQYNVFGKRDESNEIDSMLPSNMQAVVIK